MASGDRYPGILRATLAIAYDNGGVNRDRPERAVRDALVLYLAGYPTQALLDPIDAWLSGLSDEALETCCAGEDTDRATLLAGAPDGANALLNEIFERVA